MNYGRCSIDELKKCFICELKIRINFLPSSSIILITVPEPSITPLVIDGFWKERLYCSIVSIATVSLMIVKLGSPSDWDPRATYVAISCTSTPDISTVESWVPGPKVTRY